MNTETQDQNNDTIIQIPSRLNLHPDVKAKAESKKWFYTDTVKEHFFNPKNIFISDAEADEYAKNCDGIGMVGSPACITGETLVAVADGRKFISIKELTEQGKNIPVYSYGEGKIQIRTARFFRKTRINAAVWKVTLYDNTSFKATDDHNLMLENGSYKIVSVLKIGDNLMSFANNSEISYENGEIQLIKKTMVKRTVKSIEFFGYEDVYNTTVDEFHNYGIITDTNQLSGIIVKNCGDAMKMWIKVDNKEDKIKELKWQTFGCLLGSSRIMTPIGIIKIKDLKPGDKVWSWDENKIVDSKVLGLVKREVKKEDMLKITFKRKLNSKSNFHMYVTKEHLFFINGKWLMASELKNGDELFHLPEKEWRSLNNVGRRDWLREENSIRLKNNNPMFDTNIVAKTVQTYKKLLKEGKVVNWMQTTEGKMKTAERMKIDNPMFDPKIAKKNRESMDIRPTGIEKIIINIINKYNLPIRYVGDGKFWVTDSDIKKCKNPDFKVNHQRKLIEVYVSDYPWQKRDESWMNERKSFFEKQGFKVLFLDMNKKFDLLIEIQNFLHNGEKIVEIRPITKLECGSIKSKNGLIEVYDLQLTPPHNFFSWRVLSHNCASAIASTSMLSTMVTENEGMKIEDALKLKPQDIMARLGGLPNRKFHCSVLGDKALRSAINDYFRRSNQTSRIIVEGARIIDPETKTTDKDIEEAVLDGALTFEDVQKKLKVGIGNKAVVPAVEELIRFYKEKYFG